MLFLLQRKATNEERAPTTTTQTETQIQTHTHTHSIHIRFHKGREITQIGPFPIDIQRVKVSIGIFKHTVGIFLQTFEILFLPKEFS